MAPFDKSHTRSYWRSIAFNSLALSCTISEIKRDIGRKSPYPFPLGESRRNIAIKFGTKKTRMVWLGSGEKV